MHMRDDDCKKALEVIGLSYQYQPDGPFALKDIDFYADSGEMIIVSGLSGCGKSTLCYCLSGAVRHNRDGFMTGRVLLNGQDIRKLKTSSMSSEVGIVFQNPDTQLFSFTVEDEVAFAPENMCLPPCCIRERVDRVLELLGISALREAHPYQLSGGEKSLVALAAVLALDPPVLILDEVMSQLDSKGRKRVKEVLIRLRDMGKTIIAVEHNIKDMAFADRMMVMGEGRLLGCGPMERILSDYSLMEAGKLVADF